MMVYLYHYYFAGMPKPVIIQATDKVAARVLLRDFLDQSPDYATKTGKDIVSETVSEPVTGITERVINGKKYLWAGLDYGNDGWAPEEFFKDPSA